jgi:hypothetical protein
MLTTGSKCFVSKNGTRAGVYATDSSQARSTLTFLELEHCTALLESGVGNPFQQKLCPGFSAKWLTLASAHTSESRTAQVVEIPKSTVGIRGKLDK